VVDSWKGLLVMSEEIYSQEDKAAFMRVGEFLNWFSQLEMQIDETIIRVLRIELLAGRLLLSYTPCRNKCEFLKKLASLSELAFTREELADAKDTIGRIQKLHDIRNVLAHSFFKAETDGVKFLKAEKRIAADTRETINHETFERHRNDMAHLWGKLAQIAVHIQKKMNRMEVAEAMARARFEEELAPFSKPH
jgi:hypothetical protein